MPSIEFNYSNKGVTGRYRFYFRLRNDPHNCGYRGIGDFSFNRLSGSLQSKFTQEDYKLIGRFITDALHITHSNVRLIHFSVKENTHRKLFKYNHGRLIKVATTTGNHGSYKVDAYALTPYDKRAKYSQANVNTPTTIHKKYSKITNVIVGSGVW